VANTTAPAKIILLSILAPKAWDAQYPHRPSLFKYQEETMQANEVVSGALILALVTFSGTAVAADIVNKPLAACPAEKKPIGDVNSCGKKWKIR